MGYLCSRCEKRIAKRGQFKLHGESYQSCISSTHLALGTTGVPVPLPDLDPGTPKRELLSEARLPKGDGRSDAEVSSGALMIGPGMADPG